MPTPFGPTYGAPAPGPRPGGELVIRSVASPAAAGKTFALKEHAVRLAALGIKVAIAQPSLFLIQQTYDGLVEEAQRIGRDVPIRAITSAAESVDNVSRELVNHLRHASGGQVLLISHAALMRNPYWHRYEDWLLFVDEIPQVVWSQERTLPVNHGLITEAIDAEPYDAAYAKIVAKDETRLKHIAENAGGDEAYALVQEAARHILSPHWDVFCIDAQYQRLLSRDDGEGRLSFFGVLNPSLFAGFRQVTILGAGFGESLLAHLWAGRVTFKPHAKLTAALRYDAHPNGERLTISHAIERDWSKHLRDTKIDGGRTVLDDVVERAGAHFGAAPFVWMGNNDLPDGLFGDRGRRLPNSPHGLNQFQGYHNAIVLSALNPTPAHFHFLESRGANAEEVKTGLYRQAVYQAAARTSLRDLKADDPVRVIVADRATAEWMAKQFPGATVAALPGGADVPARARKGPAPKYATEGARKAADADRKAEHHAREKRRLTDHLRVLNGLATGPFESSQTHHKAVWDDMRKDVDLVKGQVVDFVLPDGRRQPDLGGTFFDGTFSRRPADHQDAATPDAFIADLKRVWATTVPEKDACGLFSPAISDPDAEYAAGVAAQDKTKRGYANILALSGIFFDCDDGSEFTPEEFARLFPRYRAVACNTYSSTKVKPRWRAFMPTTHLMSVAVHKHVVEQLLRVLNTNGWWSRKQLDKNPNIKARRCHGLDVDKTKVPTSLFFLPCQAAELGASFWKDFDDEKRKPVDPFERVDKTIAPSRPDPVVEPAATTPRPAEIVIGDVVEATRGTSDRMTRLRTKMVEHERMTAAIDRRRAVDAAVQEWRESQTAPGNGNTAFFDLAVAQARAGVSLSDIKRILWAEVGFARSPAERRGDLRRTMRTIRRSYPGLA